MEFFRTQSDIPFMRFAKIFNIISLLTFILAVTFIAIRGLNFSVEFTGGSLIEMHYEHPPALETIREALAGKGFKEAQVQNFGSSHDILLRLPSSEDTDQKALSTQIMDTLTAVEKGSIETRRVEFVGPQVGKELAENGGMALLFVVIGIMLYLALRFEWRFALSAIIANLHDVIIIIGFFAFFQWEFSLPVLAAVLAVLGYSVNESVVIFDRVRETFKKRRDLDTPQVINHAITSTISRTVITHGSTLMMVLAMLLFGGETLHYFALALTIGICFGIYSSVLVSSPIVMWLGVSREQFTSVKKVKEEAVV